MRIDILTIFPGMFQGIVRESLIAKAVEKKRVSINCIDIRTLSSDKHHTVDDRPFGGGPGMVMKVEPVVKALDLCKRKSRPTVVLLSPQGKLFDHRTAQRFARKKHLVMICGHYEGIDERIRHFCDYEISIGDYVLTGGEIPAMVLTDAVVRLVPGVVGSEESIRQDSFYTGRLDYPQYTRPRIFRGLRVPPLLFSGNHAAIFDWRKRMSVKNTMDKRPDLFAKCKPTKAEKVLMQQMRMKQ
ncbi:MAG: tRNA (guanosine(37)-N1)-methyltransferase TrmD [Elusimicrobia bacterium]|nr:tRNA (guanosine(37)-N1)-methyltransferase TrmD [Elusimicrobiota bacterium]MBD3412664.1 tRNA (guanosine(37)-N1)-methyltransferase TrmD [Elusimicrobiota bacterium]